MLQLHFTACWWKRVYTPTSLLFCLETTPTSTKAQKMTHPGYRETLTVQTLRKVLRVKETGKLWIRIKKNKVRNKISEFQHTRRAIGKHKKVAHQCGQLQNTSTVNHQTEVTTLKISDDDFLKHVNISSSHKLCAARTECNLLLVCERWEPQSTCWPKEQEKSQWHFDLNISEGWNNLHYVLVSCFVSFFLVFVLSYMEFDWFYHKRVIKIVSSK